VSIALNNNLSNGKTLSEHYDSYFQEVVDNHLDQYSAEEIAEIKPLFITADNAVVEAYKLDNNVAIDSEIAWEGGTRPVSWIYLDIVEQYRTYDDNLIPDIDLYIEMKFENILSVMGDLV